ncbi:hypothetical protein FSPOR_7508 [Fusarium sporotrichioides]|uniref:Uncharacterized protein n=1 Tax=Fusarium sporotrichioides TaxID=5514 RepID=A0A395RY84_FUSSP|nr:hypothetical protein FSPOR_7508 [Fusarium sporotrichioides]
MVNPRDDRSPSEEINLDQLSLSETAHTNNLRTITPLDENLYQALSTFNDLQKLGEDIKQQHANKSYEYEAGLSDFVSKIINALDKLIVDIDVNAPEIEGEERLRSFDPHIGLSSHQLGEAYKRILYRDPGDSGSGSDMEAADDFEPVNQPVKKAYWASSFTYSPQERLPGWRSRVFDSLISHIVSQPGYGSMRDQLQQTQQAPRESHSSEIKFSSFLHGPLVFGARSGFFRRTNDPASPGFSVEEILRMYRDHDIAVAMFNRIMALMVSIDGTMNTSYVPMTALTALDMRNQQLKALSETFRPRSLALNVKLSGQYISRKNTETCAESST